jgi:hypothetical protein
MHNDNTEQAPTSSDSEHKSGQSFLSLRTMYLLGSLGTFSLGLLLLYHSWVPLVVCFPFGASVTSFLFGVMETDRVQNKLDAVFTSPGVKVVAQLTGAVAVFGIVSAFSYLALDKELQRKEIELGISRAINDPTYIYLVAKNSIHRDGKGSMIVVGKLNFSDEFEAIKGNEKNKEGNVLNPILVKIRNECSYGGGLCSISDSIFPVHINNIGNLQSANLNAVNDVKICPGHSYLQKKTLLISSDLNLLKSFKKDESKKFPDKSYKVRINDESNPAICPDSNLTPSSPILLFGNKKTKNPIPISRFSTYYAIDSGDSEE